MPLPKFVAALVVFALGSTFAEAQDARRQPGAHTHGEGLLAIAIDGNRLQMELEAPASDIVGFEHTPKSAAQKKAITDAKARLAKPGDLFKLSAETGCKLVSANVEVLGAAAGAAKAGAHAGHSHGKAAQGEAKAADTAADAATQHSEFRATYALDCANLAKLRSITFEYFNAFKRAERLVVTLIGPTGQTRGEVTPAKPVLDIGGAT